VNMLINIFVILLQVWNKEDFLALKKQDREMMGRFYTMYKDMIYDFFMYKTENNSDLAEELFSRTFEHAFKGLPGLSSGKNLSAWVFRIAYRRFYDHLRQQYRKKELVARLKINSDFSQADHLGEMEDNEIALLVREALAQLKDDYREILTMKYIQNMTHPQIATKTGRSVKTIESWHYRARNALEKQLKSMIDDKGILL
jgi:RNA polymerase sigma-70 factor (ECF subfamily)